jgi:tRNA G18 (ribose-2'-O)-methylase SpoU
MASPKSQKSVKENEENNKSEHSVEINFEEEEPENRKYINQNIKNITSMKEIIRKVSKKNIELGRINIPKIMLDIPKLSQGSKAPKMKLSNFTRYDIH